MANLCTKVTVRKRPVKNGQTSLYLDFYPAIRNPKTGRMTRREFLNMYIYTNPTEKFQVEYNKKMMQKAELIKCQRTVAIINNDFGFIDHESGKGDFLAYFAKKKKEYSNDRNWQITLKHFTNYCKGKCTFDCLTIDFCQKFLDYLLRLDTPSGTKMMGTTANGHFKKLMCILYAAYEDGHIKENIAPKLKTVKAVSRPKVFLTMDEIKQLAATPCKSAVLKSAALFSCLTGLRISDIIQLRWSDIIIGEDNGWCMHIVTQKTKEDAFLPLSDEALALCGERSQGRVFKGLSKGVVTFNLKPWIQAAGITKHVTFHSFRHSFATLQVAAGTDIYTVSRLLTHRNVTTTQVYADVVDGLKREASEKLSLK